MTTFSSTEYRENKVVVAVTFFDYENETVQVRCFTVDRPAFEKWSYDGANDDWSSEYLTMVDKVETMDGDFMEYDDTGTGHDMDGICELHIELPDHKPCDWDKGFNIIVDSLKTAGLSPSDVIIFNSEEDYMEGIWK